MTSDGMPTNSVFDIAQHPSGMMWFMTKNGPVYYDSDNWYAFSDSLDLPSSSNSKIITVDSVIWVAGLNKTDFTIQSFTDKWEKLEVPFESDLFERHIAFKVFKNEVSYEVIVGANNSLFILDIMNQSWSTIDTDTLAIKSISLIGSRKVISTSHGLWELRNGKLEIIDLPYSQLPSRYILSFNYQNGMLRLLGYNWYAEIMNNEVTFLVDDVGLVSSSLLNQSSLVVDQNDNVFFGSSTPARIIDHENVSWQNLMIKGENINIGSTSIYCDNENNIWVSDARGLFKFNVLQFLSYNNSSGLANDEVTVVDQLSNGTMLIANPHDFNLLEKNNIKQYSYGSTKDLTFRFLSVEVDEVNNRIYMATNSAGLLVYEIGKYERPIQIFSGNQLEITAVKKFNGTIYAAGINGIYVVENDEIKKFSSHGNLRNISTIGNSLAFLSNRDGVFIYDGSSFQHYNSPNYDLSSVFHATIYNEDTLLATRDGLGIIKNGSIKAWDAIDINTPSYSLLVDSKNQLWIGSDRGVYLYKDGTLQLFDTNQGLTGNEINRNAVFEDSQGKIWIGTEKGVSIYQDNKDLQRNINLTVNIPKVVAKQNKPLESFEDNIIPYESNGLEIEFQCLSYVDEEKINYRYRINQSSNNNQWITTSNSNNNIIFSNIQSGDYQFEIQARFGTGDWGPVSSFQFKVNSPFYVKWWFVAACIITLISIARTIFYFRYILLIRRQKKLKQIVALRTKEIRLLNEQLEEKVMKRTKELHDKNLRLEDYAYVNAHHLRAPLTKIMSVLNVVDITSDEKLDQSLIGILKESVEEMDEVIHSINEILKK